MRSFRSCSGRNRNHADAEYKKEANFMSADFEGNDKDAVVTQQVLDVIDSYGFKKEGAYTS